MNKPMLILLEGGDTFTIMEMAEKLKQKLERERKKVVTVFFPMYNDKSGDIVNKHIRSYPKPSYDKKITFEELQQGQKVFIKYFRGGNIILEYGIIVKKFPTKIKFNVGYSVNDDNTFYLIRQSIDDGLYEFYPDGCDRIFDTKASHATKALTFTMDRNIWFTNHKDELLSADVVIVNRSYQSNFLYRTVSTQDLDEFMEYIITIMNIEVLSLGLENFDIKTFFVKPKTLNALEDKIEKECARLHITEEEKLREFQYIKTIHYNLEHLRSLYKACKREHASIYEKYAKFLDFEVLEVSYEDYMSNNLEI